MKRLRVYTTSIVAIVLSATLGQYFLGDTIRARVDEWRRERQMAAFVSCVDSGTDSVVIMDAGRVADGQGVYIAAVASRPQPEKFPERAGPGVNDEINRRRTLRVLARASDTWATVLGCLVDEVPWAGYLKVTMVSLVPHFDQLSGTRAVSITANYQIVIRSRADIRALRLAYSMGSVNGSWPGNEMMGDWILEERVVVVDFAYIELLGGSTELKEKLPFSDTRERILRVASITLMQDKAETPTGVP